MGGGRLLLYVDLAGIVLVLGWRLLLCVILAGVCLALV